jgi:CheY-like chemotaxis protein
VAARALRRILLVEDDKDIAGLVVMVLAEQAGYAVRACLSARQALEALSDFQPDLILLDVMMPEADGLSALKGLRAREATRDTPVVFLTAMAAPADMACYESVGALGVVTKPFDPLTLAPTLERLWNGRKAARGERRPNPQFEALRREYAAELPERITALCTAAAGVREKGWDRPLVEWLRLQAHRLAGSAGIYRMSDLHRAAGVLEDWLSRLLAQPWPPAAQPAELATLVRAVRRVTRLELRPPDGASGAPARKRRAYPRAAAVRPR